MPTACELSRLRSSMHCSSILVPPKVHFPLFPNECLVVQVGAKLNGCATPGALSVFTNFSAVDLMTKEPLTMRIVLVRAFAAAIGATVSTTATTYAGLSF